MASPSRNGLFTGVAIPAAAAGDDRSEAGAAERTGDEIRDFGFETTQHQRRGDRAQQRAQLRTGGGGHADGLDVSRTLRKRRDPVVNCGKRGREPLLRDRQFQRRRCLNRRRGTAVASFISAIGVMPAIGSFENAPME